MATTPATTVAATTIPVAKMAAAVPATTAMAVAIPVQVLTIRKLSAEPL